MELVTTGLGAGSYPEPDQKIFVDDTEYEEALRRAFLYSKHFQGFSDSQDFAHSFEGECWRELGEAERQSIIRNCMRIYFSADDCRRFKREYLKRHCFEYEDYLFETGIIHR